ncbi:MAG: hypothetical protein ACI8Z1_001208 [Candidatus Azotimanducaceae bacterium]|jgi:hypothetical protein
MASGLVVQLDEHLSNSYLRAGQRIKVVVRSAENLPDIVSSHKNLSVIEANISDLSDTKMTDTVGDCDVVASCLGQKLSFKRMFGSPRRLLTETTRRLCRAR